MPNNEESGLWAAIETCGSSDYRTDCSGDRWELHSRTYTSIHVRIAAVHVFVKHDKELDS